MNKERSRLDDYSFTLVVLSTGRLGIPLEIEETLNKRLTTAIKNAMGEFGESTKTKCVFASVEGA